MTLVDLVDRLDGVERSIVVVNRTEPDPIRNLLVDTFGDDTVDVVDRSTIDAVSGASDDVDGGTPAVETLVGDGSESIDVDDLRDSDEIGFDGEDPDEIENLVLLLEGDEIVAASPLDALVNAILLVNSDLYVTGTRGLEDLDLPSVITGLHDTVFSFAATRSRTDRNCF